MADAPQGQLDTIDMNEKRFDEPCGLNDVAAFHKTFKLPVLEQPSIPSADRCRLRVNLLAEELDELKAAIEAQDMVEIADALCDLQYVLSGAVLEFGLADRFKAMFDAVHASNMSKVCSTREEAEATVAAYAERGQQGHIVEQAHGYLVYRDDDQKVLKSINYRAVDISIHLGDMMSN